MHSSLRAEGARNPRHAASAFQSVTVNLPGRLMLASYEEHDCLVVEMSPGDALIECHGRARNGERIVAYVDHIGRIEGHVIEARTGSFTMSITATDRKREKFAAQLIWLANKHELGLPEDRRHDRLTPRNSIAQLMLEDGTVLPCRILDLSLSGAAIDIDNRPPLGTPVRLGNMPGRVVRHFMEGVAIEFNRVQSRDTLQDLL